jgi:hypothetical protein
MLIINTFFSVPVPDCMGPWLKGFSRENAQQVCRSDSAIQLLFPRTGMKTSSLNNCGVELF